MLFRQYAVRFRCPKPLIFLTSAVKPSTHVPKEPQQSNCTRHHKKSPEEGKRAVVSWLTFCDIRKIQKLKPVTQGRHTSSNFLTGFCFFVFWCQNLIAVSLCCKSRKRVLRLSSCIVSLFLSASCLIAKSKT